MGKDIKTPPPSSLFQPPGKHEVGIEGLQALDSGRHLHLLDIAPLLPFKPRANSRTGRVLGRIVKEVLEEQLSEKDCYTKTSANEYILYIGTNPSLAALKLNILCKEISRKINIFIEDSASIAEDSGDTGEHYDHKTAPVSERWKPEVEPLPRTPADEPEKIKMANNAMLEMLRERERDDGIKDYKAFSRDLEVAYTPVWNVPKNHLTAFIAQVPLLTTDMDHMSLARLRADYDLGTLVKAGRELSKMVWKGKKIVIILPVSLSTLERYPSINLFLHYCQKLSADVRALIVLKIENIPPGLPGYKLYEILQKPASMVRSVIISSDLRQKRFDPLEPCRIHAFSVSLGAAEEDGKRIFTLLDRFAEITQSINHLSMAENIPNRSLLCAAVAAGITYISGTPIQYAQDTLDTIRPFDLLEIYKNP